MPETLSQTTAAALLGVSSRRLRQLSKTPDAPPQDDAGRYPVAAFGEWLRQRNSGGSTGADCSAYERRAHWQAELARIKFLAEQRELIPIEAHRDGIHALSRIVVRALVTLPDKLERDLRISPAIVEYVDKCIGILRDEMAASVLASCGDD